MQHMHCMMLMRGSVTIEIDMQVHGNLATGQPLTVWEVSALRIILFSQLSSGSGSSTKIYHKNITYVT